MTDKEEENQICKLQKNIHASRLINHKGQRIAFKECFVLFAAYLPPFNVIESCIDYSNVVLLAVIPLLERRVNLFM